MGGADTSPTSLLVHLWIKLCTDHYCLTNRTEDKGIRALNETHLLMRDWLGLMLSSN
jgi:hypothetical protein